MEERLSRLRKKAMNLPSSPGVYIMRDELKNIIYIGKSKTLKNRVSQYFGSSKSHTNKVLKMVSKIEDFEYILTDSEFEALVLECSLIKQHTPKYNILLKDDKGYHYIKITSEEWPRILEAKQKLDDNALYIGPYTSSWSVKRAVDEALKIFKLPSCSKKFPRDIGKSRPCLNYYIKQCLAPCNGKISNKEYNEYINEAKEFLIGGSNLSIRELESKMMKASENLEFEKAARIRDRIVAVKKIKDKQKVVSLKIPDQDVIALATNERLSCFEVFKFSSGRLCDREEFFVKDIGLPEVARTEFIERYYSIRDKIPPQVTVDGNIEDKDVISDWLSDKLGKKVKIVNPSKGEQAKLVEMCKKNAEESLAQKIGRTGKETSALNELAELLGLKKYPSYIEAYDISNLGGSENVAGMVVFEQGRPLKSAYRKFKIKGFEGQDDYESMREVITRRLEEYEKNKESNVGFGRLPDLILLDGGKGHVSSVLPIIEQYGYDIPVYGMVKDNKHKTRAIAKNEGEIAINSNRQAFVLISSIQNEVHRFAIGYHRKLRKSKTISTILNSIPGVGEKRSKILLKHFKTIRNIKEASYEDLCHVSGINKQVARAVYDYFQNN